MKLAAIDLDGTLLNSQGEISKENREAIRAVQEQGFAVTIATGRVFYNVQKIIDKANLNTHIISANGATVHAKDGRLISSIPMRETDIEKIVAWLIEHDYYFEVYTDHAIYTPHNGREQMLVELDRFESANPEFNGDHFRKMIDHHFGQQDFKFFKTAADIINGAKEYYKVLGFSMNHEKLKAGWQQFEGMEHVSIVSSADHNFELQHREASKGNALKRLAEELQVSMQDTIAIGDNYNDVSMFEKAGHSVAMGNAKAEIKELCSHVTARNDENGVAKALYHFAKQQ